jgi:nucleotide-binding universal stress UspA family protein
MEYNMFERILVPLDGSELATKILPQVVEMAKRFQAEVTLLHVCYYSIWTEIAAVPPEVLEKGKENATKWCSTFLREAAKRLQFQGVTVKTKCVAGVPPREIIHYASENKIDLIAMATHGSGEVAWVLGSTAEKVVTHAPMPVLLVRVVGLEPPLSLIRLLIEKMRVSLGVGN